MQGAKVLSNEEIQTLLDTKNQRDRMLILTGLYFGTKISESLKLTFGDFKGTHVRIKSAKGSEDRTLLIPEQFKKNLQKLRDFYINKTCPVEDDTPLFLSQKKDNQGYCKPITPEHTELIVRNLRKKKGLDSRVSAHSFRKSFTTKIHELTNNNLIQTAVYTGHKSIDSLKYYIETTQETNLIQQLNWT